MHDLILKLTPRRVRIEPNKRRHKYINQLERQVEKHETLINNLDIPDNLGLHAFTTLRRPAYTMVNHYHTEKIDEEITELKRIAEEQGLLDP